MKWDDLNIRRHELITKGPLTEKESKELVELQRIAGEIRDHLTPDFPPDLAAMIYRFEDFNPDGMVPSDIEGWRDYLAGADLDVLSLEITKDLELTEKGAEVSSRAILRTAILDWLYCASKARAMRLREGGQIQHAIACEEVCQLLYERMPIKW